MQARQWCAGEASHAAGTPPLAGWGERAGSAGPLPQPSAGEGELVARCHRTMTRRVAAMS